MTLKPSFFLALCCASFLFLGCDDSDESAHAPDGMDTPECSTNDECPAEQPICALNAKGFGECQGEPGPDDAGAMDGGMTGLGGSAGAGGASGAGGAAGIGGEDTPTVLTLSVDTRCADMAAQSVRLVGPQWNDWDPNSGPVANDDDGDGIWSVTFDPIPVENIEYLWTLNGQYEALIGVGDCTPITDNANYANRLWTPSEGDRVDSYNACEDCDPESGNTGGMMGEGGEAGTGGEAGAGGEGGAGGEEEPDPVPEGALLLELDTRCANPRPESVRLVGPWWNDWGPVDGPVANDADGDGIWRILFDPAPGADMEYLWNVDGQYESLIGAGACAPITDGQTYANRQWSQDSDRRLDTYNGCDACVPDENDEGEPGDLPRIEIQGRRILINGETFHMKGVNWNPVPRGAVHPQGLDFAGLVERDAPLMRAAGINVVRTYEAILDEDVLDVLWAHGIYVMSTVYGWGGAAANSAVDKVIRTKDHPAILMWVVGNEWNYNGLYNGLNREQCIQRIDEVARLIKEADPSRPVASIYGEQLDAEAFNRLGVIDVWGLNVYRGIGFGDLFDTYAARSPKPMFLGEYGADAYNARINAEDQAAQAEATRVLTQLIVDNSTVTGGACSGGFIFEWADEWWKAPGDPNVHDTGGAAPGGGPHPDGVFNEEWWGLVEIDGTPRLAYEAYGDIPIPQAP